VPYADEAAGAVGVVQDITERHEADEALRKTQTRLQMAVEAGQMGDWEWTIATGKVHWSSALEAIHGLPAGGFGGTFEDFQRDIHPEDRAKVLTTIQQCVDTRTDYRIDYRIIKANGSMAWIEARAKLYLDARGDPERMIGICMDATSRKQTEERLRDDTRVLELLSQVGPTLASELELQPLLQAVTDTATQ
jgi:PAS domain S-box-containing protein